VKLRSPSLLYNMLVRPLHVLAAAELVLWKRWSKD
jgi:hypothetical protein